jgi:hypothetical protein
LKYKRGDFKLVLSIAQQFSETPGARTREDGPFSGEEFLETHLLPAFTNAISTKEPLVVDLDGTEGYATSFLEAAFGGLARKHPQLDVLTLLQLKSEGEPYLIDEIVKYVNDARRDALKQ